MSSAPRRPEEVVAAERLHRPVHRDGLIAGLCSEDGTLRRGRADS